MRDPLRQEELLDLIESIWKKYPDLRLGQLIENVAGDSEQLYFMEDDELYKRLCEVYPL